MIVSILYGTLYAADTYGMRAPWVVALVHAAPLAGMPLLYTSRMHTYHAEQRTAADAVAAVAAAQVTCRSCGQECKKKPAAYAHVRTCPRILGAQPNPSFPASTSHAVQLLSGVAA